MKNTLFPALIACLLLLLPIRVMGNKQYAFQQINTQDGLSSSVRCLAVSHEKGYVWIGTKVGIGRFDGYELKKYMLGNITHILEDKEHTIWAITPKGLFYYDYREDIFIQARDNDNNPVAATSICLWEDGVLFIGNGSLYKYSYTDHQLKYLYPLTPKSNHNLTLLQRWDERTLLGINRWSRSLLIDVPTGQTRPAPFDTVDLTASFIDRQGNIWITPYNQGVRCYDRNGKLLHAFHTQNSPLQTNVILSITENNGKIWLGTDGAGIYILDPKDGSMSVLSHIPGDPYSLPVNSILCLYTDINHNIWAGSVRGGLINIREVSMKIYQDALPGMDYGLSEKAILSIYQDEGEEDIWIGTDGGGINRFNSTTKKFHHVLSTWKEKIPSITGIDNKRLLVSFFSKGLFFFDKQNETCQPLIIVNDSINAIICQRGKSVNVFQNTPETVLLLSEFPYSYHIVRKEFTPIASPQQLKEIIGPLQPICRKESISYLHDSKHIYRIDSRKNVLEVFYECGEDTVINSISADENDNFWIGGNHGLGYYSMEKKQYTPIPNSLINEINSLVCDKQGRVWIGTEGKLFARLIHKGEFILYGESDGITLNEYLEKPRLLSTQGDIYMGGVNGLLCINKRLPIEPDTPPKLRLGDVSVGGVRMNKAIEDGQKLEIKEQRAAISIKITAHDKDIFSKPMYRYTLRSPGSQITYSYLPELTLSSLPPGTYEILAACSTRTGGWTKDYPILKLVILPPWYKSGWFIACCIIVLLGGVLLAFLFLLRRKESKLKWKMKEHEQQVYEEKVRYLININHELRTPLTLIHAPLKQLLASLTPDDEKYPIIQSITKQSGRMKKLLNMVLDVRKMEVGQSTLNIETIELNTWIDQLMADFKPEAGIRGITLSFRPDGEMDNLCCDKEKCTTILTNLLINALKYSPDNGRISVSVSTTEGNNCVRISVSDQGPGLKDVDINNLFVRFYQGNNSRPGTGIGLSYSKILTEQHGGSISAYDHGSEPGATFWFELPGNIPPGKLTLQPQPYLNELLASSQETETMPDGFLGKDERQNCTLLIVDDNKDLTDYLAGALTDKYKKILTAFDGEEALQICREAHPDVIVSDIQMPRMNGYELCKQVKEDLEISHTPVVLLTARNDEESRIYGYKNGADVYLTKPFEVNTLHTAIQSLLRNRERIRERYAEAGPMLQPQESTFSSADEKFLYKLNKTISANLSNQELNVPFLCKEIGISRAGLYTKMKALTGMGANDYINKLRLEQATHLLVHSELSINEIADQTGFSTARYFSTVFKQCMGVSPTQYKEDHPALK